MAEGTSTKSYDETYKKAVFELLKKNWDYKNNRLNNSDIVDMETHIHPPIGRGVSTNHKSSNRIELSQLCQDFLNS